MKVARSLSKPNGIFFSVVVMVLSTVVVVVVSTRHFEPLDISPQANPVDVKTAALRTNIEMILLAVFIVLSLLCFTVSFNPLQDR